MVLRESQLFPQLTWNMHLLGCTIVVPRYVAVQYCTSYLMPLCSQALVILAVLGSIEWHDECKLPPQLSFPHTRIRIPADGRCLWYCLWLGTEAMIEQVYAWHQRPRSRVGFASGEDGAIEKRTVTAWLNRLSAEMPRECLRRAQKQECAVHADLAPWLRAL